MVQRLRMILLRGRWCCA